MKQFNDKFDDIGDDEIRIVSSISHDSFKLDKKEVMEDPSCLLDDEIDHDEIPEVKSLSKPLRKNLFMEKRVVKFNKGWIIALILFIGAIIVILLLLFKPNPDSEETSRLQIKEVSPENIQQPEKLYIEQPSVTPQDEVAFTTKGFVEVSDTVINKVPLTIFKPKNLVPRLHVGIDALNDSNASFVVQAADVRRDNGQIVGAYVSQGELLSRGQSKAGFCAIINGKLVVGVADSTPYLEQAIETDGYFFRQYPLVVGGQVVENKLKPSSLRKALAELDGEIVVIMNDRKQTLNEFAQTLVDLGVSNAIYLIGSTASGFALDDKGNRLEFGIESASPATNTNYLLWE